MNSKKIFKRTLPIMIALVVVIVAALFSTVATIDKRVPTFSSDEYGEAAYITYTKGDVTVKLSRDEVYAALKNSTNSMSAAVSELVDMIDKDLLKTYIENVDVQDVYDQVAYSIFGSTFDSYVKTNEDAFKVAAKKENKNYVDYLKEQIDEQIDAFVESQKNDYAIETTTSEFTYMKDGDFFYVQEDGADKLDDDGKKVYGFEVTTSSKTYEEFALAVARHDYAVECLKADYLEDFEEYKEYLEELEEYTKYTTAVSRYEEELSIWENTLKSKRGEKPVKPNKKDFKVTEEPEAVSEPVLIESNFSSLYLSENYNTYNAIVIPYASKALAEIALEQNGIEIKQNASGKFVWTNGTTELTQSEITGKIIDLYNQFYMAYPEKMLIANTDYTVSSGVYTFTETGLEKLELTESEASNYGVYSSASQNKFNKFNADGTNEFIETYSNTINVGSSYSSIYLILAKEEVVDWEDYLGEEEYYNTTFYTEKLDELLEDATTTSYTNNYCADLRYENGLLIYDTTFESVYMSTYTSEYVTIKKTSKDAIASYKVNGEKKYIKVDDFFDAVASKYGVSAFVERYQYDWIFLECAKSNGTLINQYFDYAAYLNGTKFDKCVKSTDEAKELAEDATDYANEIYKNFKNGSYVTDDGGYPASYGWENFLRDYYYENYQWNNIKSTNDLKVFYIYQQLVSEYREYLATVTEDVYENLALIYMAQTLSDYINTTAASFDIKLVDKDGATVDPANWTTAQLNAAARLYDEVLALLTKVESGNISTVLAELVSVYNAAPLTALDGTTPNAASIKYNYDYYGKDATTPATVHCSEYKSLGFTISYSSSITVLSSTDEILEAARTVWNSILPQLIKDVTVSDMIIFDHTYIAPSYIVEDNDINNINSDSYLTDKNGMHIYFNVSSSLSTYMITDSESYDDDSLLIHSKMYAYEKTNSTNAEYKSFETLYREYVEASTTDKTAIQEAIMDIVSTDLGYSSLTFTKFLPYLEEYVYDENTFIGFPSRVHVLMYLYDKTQSSESDYESFDDLYDDYMDAVEEDGTESTDDTKAAIEVAKESIMTIVTEKLELDLAFADFLPYLEAYADSDTSSYVTSQITSWFTTYSTSSSTLIYSDLSSSYYVQLQMFESLVNDLGSVTYADAATKELCEATIKDFVEQYYDNLPILSLIRENDADAVKALLEAMQSRSHFYSYIKGTDTLDTLFKYGEYADEKALMEKAFDTLYDYVQEAYNKLTETEKEELKDLYDAVIVIS